MLTTVESQLAPQLIECTPEQQPSSCDAYCTAVQACGVCSSNSIFTCVPDRAKAVGWCVFITRLPFPALFSREILNPVASPSPPPNRRHRLTRTQPFCDHARTPTRTDYYGGSSEESEPREEAEECTSECPEGEDCADGFCHGKCKDGKEKKHKHPGPLGKHGCPLEAAEVAGLVTGGIAAIAMIGAGLYVWHLFLLSVRNCVASPCGQPATHVESSSLVSLFHLQAYVPASPGP